MGKGGVAALAVLLALGGLGAPNAHAQTAGHRFAVDGGVVLYDLVPRTSREITLWQMGGRAYLGRYVYAFGEVLGDFTYGAGGGPAGLALVSSRSARLRFLLRGGYIVPAGLPLAGVGAEYGGDWGAIVNWDYVLTRMSGEGLSLLKFGVYWGR